MAGMELRSRSRVRGCVRNRLWLYRSPPKFYLSSYALAMGQRRPAANVLLLEAGFLSIFFAPWRLWPRELSLRPGSTIPVTAPVSRTALFLLKLLLFKLVLMSGLVKLTSGDPSWWNLTALDYHYWSQPLPTL